MASDSLSWGERLQAWRNAQSLTRVQLAPRLEVDPGAIYRWEKRGDPVLSDRQAELLQKITGIAPERARRAASGPSVGKRLAALEQRVAELERRLDDEATGERIDPPAPDLAIRRAADAISDHVSGAATRGQRARRARP